MAWTDPVSLHGEKTKTGLNIIDSSETRNIPKCNGLLQIVRQLKNGMEWTLPKLNNAKGDMKLGLKRISIQKSRIPM